MYVISRDVSAVGPSKRFATLEEMERASEPSARVPAA